jgi:hypothetical protein
MSKSRTSWYEQFYSLPNWIPKDLPRTKYPANPVVVEPVVMDEVIIPIHMITQPAVLVKDQGLNGLEFNSVIRDAARTFGYTMLATPATHALDVMHARLVLKSNQQESLLKGLGFNIWTNMIRNSLLLFGMPLWKSALQDKVSPEHLEAVAFGGASVVEGVVWGPISVIKQLLYTRNTKNVAEVIRQTPFMDLFAAIKHNVFWGGLIRNSLMAFPFMALRNQGERRFIRQDDSNTAQALKQFGIGVGAGFTANVFAYPAEWIRMQMIDHPHLIAWELVKSSYKKEGLRVFYKGFSVAALRMSVASGAMSVAFLGADKLCSLLSKSGFFSAANKKELEKLAQAEKPVPSVTASRPI